NRDGGVRSGVADTASRMDVRQARGVLGIDRLVLEIQDPSFPGDTDEDVGRGTPYSRGGRRVLAYVPDLRVDGGQLRPQGQPNRGNPSPFASRIFPRDFQSVAIGALAREPRWRGLVDDATLAALVAARPPGSSRAHHDYAWDATARALDVAYAAFVRRRGEL